MHIGARVQRLPLAALRRSALLLLLAWLPSLAYVGHWEALASPASAHALAHERGAAPDGSHAQHCHGSFDGCSGSEAPAPALTHGLEVAAPLTVPTGGVAAGNDRVLAGRAVTPILPPPRSVI